MLFMLANTSKDVQQYLIVTGNYWAFTLTDGALRMLVVLHFYTMGYTALQIALLFVFYEFFGVVTNLLGGWIGARVGLNSTMNTGLLLQIGALAMLFLPNEVLSVAWVMAAQALSGIAKDLNKMSAKSAVKLLVPEDAQGTLYHWVSVLTGSKNALKGLGFFLGAGLLEWIGFRGATFSMAVMLFVILCFSVVNLRQDLGRTKAKPKFREIFSKSRSVNSLSAARLFLFASRDVWFVVALPVYLASRLQWDHWAVGSFLALWIMGYGLIQGVSPRITRRVNSPVPDRNIAIVWALSLAVVPFLMVLLMYFHLFPTWVLISGLFAYGCIFAVNSSLHSFLIVSYAKQSAVSLDVGFYYMANAIGRLLGTVLSGWLYVEQGLEACLLISAIFVLLATVFSMGLPRNHCKVE